MASELKKIKTNNKEYSVFCISEFRKGIAIASTQDFDCLINEQGEVIYSPSIFRCYIRDINPRLQRAIGGYYILLENKDTSAPGKDWHWQGPYCVRTISENGVEVSLSEEKKYPVYDRGNRIVQYKNDFYDLDTYNLLFSIPESCYVLGIFSDNNGCTIYDKKHEKDIIVLTEQQQIISSFDILNIPQELKTRIFPEPKEIKERIIHYTKGIYHSNISYSSLYEDFLNLNHIDSNFNKLPYLSYPVESNIRMLSDFYGIFHILKIDCLFFSYHKNLSISRYEERQSEIGDNYQYKIYNNSGCLENKSPYTKLLYKGNEVMSLSKSIEDNEIVFYYERKQEKGFIKCKLYNNGWGNRTEFIETPFPEFLSNKIIEIIYNKEPIIICFNEESSRYGKRDYSNFTYYDVNYNKLSIMDSDENILPYEELIKHYLYRLRDEEIISSCEYWEDQEGFRESLADLLHHNLYAIGNKILIPNEISIQETIKHIVNLVQKSNDFIEKIEPYESFIVKRSNNLYPTLPEKPIILYRISYKPHGRLDMRGDIQYHYTNIDEVFF